MLSSFKAPRQHQCSQLPQPRLAKDKLQGVLDESTKARAKSIQLKGTQFADELSGKLLKHANKMEDLYAELKLQINQKKPDDCAINSVLARITRKQDWYKSAEASFGVKKQ